MYMYIVVTIKDYYKVTLSTLELFEAQWEK